MAKVSVAGLERACARNELAGCEVDGMISALFDRPADPIHVHVLELPAGGHATFQPVQVDRVAYVWHGTVQVGATTLAQGSSIILERHAGSEIATAPDGARIVLFAAAQPCSAERKGGSVHLLPAERVPRYACANGLTGGIHADSACPTCSAWLHENGFPPMAETTPQAAEAGIHSHTENEVIFVAGGRIRLGAKLLGPGAAVAIAAGTMYSFTPGPEGLHFLNFRAEQPRDILFKNGHVMDEVAYWRDQVPAPVYC
jgi:hypothetical protein